MKLKKSDLKSIVKKINSILGTRYVYVSTIGSGTFGIVSIINTTNCGDLALKIFETDEPEDDLNMQYMMSENGLGPSIYSSGRVKHNSTEFLFVTMELFQYDCYTYLKHYVPDKIMFKKVVKSALDIIDKMVNLNIYCMDVKTSNFVIKIDTNNNIYIRMIDFDEYYCKTTNLTKLESEYLSVIIKMIFFYSLANYNISFIKEIKEVYKEVIEFFMDNKTEISNFFYGEHLGILKSIIKRLDLVSRHYYSFKNGSGVKNIIKEYASQLNKL